MLHPERRAQPETYFSPKAFLQNSAASALVIRNVSPWKRPLGKIPLSSASMWLNIRDNLVRLRLQRITEREVFFRKVTKTGRKQHPLHLQKQLSPKTPTWDCFSGVHPAPRMHPAHGADQQGWRFLGHFPPRLPRRTSLRQPGYFQGKFPPVM